METIAHRELRNSSSAVLARVAAGETIAVTNNGEVVAIMCPPHMTELERLDVTGGSRRPRRTDVDFTKMTRATGISSRELLDDMRGDL